MVGPEYPLTEGGPPMWKFEARLYQVLPPLNDTDLGASEDDGVDDAKGQVKEPRRINRPIPNCQLLTCRVMASTGRQHRKQHQDQMGTEAGGGEV